MALTVDGKVKCDNCVNAALYTQADPGVNPVNYCNLCLPQWLIERAEAGQFPLVENISWPTKKEEDKKVESKKEKDSEEEAE